MSYSRKDPDGSFEVHAIECKCPKCTFEIVMIDGLPVTKDTNGGMHHSSVAELVTEIERLRGKNAEPIAWRADDGRLMSHDLKMSLTRGQTIGFTQPLYMTPSGSNTLRWAISQLLDELPQRRDWLNPDVERILRDHAGKQR